LQDISKISHKIILSISALAKVGKGFSGTKIKNFEKYSNSEEKKPLNVITVEHRPAYLNQDIVNWSLVAMSKYCMITLDK
jgi:hypothetical protein